MFSKYIFKRDSFSIHFTNGFFVCLEFPKKSVAKALEKESIIKQIEGLLISNPSDEVEISIFNCYGENVTKDFTEENKRYEPELLIDLLWKIKNFSR